jgi:hypothetical protein
LEVRFQREIRRDTYDNQRYHFDVMHVKVK